MDHTAAYHRPSSRDEFFDAFGRGKFSNAPDLWCAHNAKPTASYCVIVADRRREAWAAPANATVSSARIHLSIAGLTSAAAVPEFTLFTSLPQLRCYAQHDHHQREQKATTAAHPPSRQNIRLRPENARSEIIRKQIKRGCGLLLRLARRPTHPLGDRNAHEEPNRDHDDAAMTDVKGCSQRKRESRHRHERASDHDGGPPQAVCKGRQQRKKRTSPNT